MHIATSVIILFFLTSGCFGKHRRSNEPHLKILPSGKQEIRAGKNLVLTCRAQVPNLELIKDLKWINPRGQEIPQDDRVYSEEQPGDAATALFIKKLSEEDAGNYRCTAIYASNQELEAKVEILVFIGITWEDAPISQYASIGEDYKVRCVVRANPPANIDWLKESLIISTGEQYVIESDGLLIKGVTKKNAGTYTCRARVPQTGELEERDVRLDVQEPPNWVLKPSNLRGVEMEKVEFRCQALGSPNPKYTWVDKEGIDATEKEGWILDETTGSLTAFQLERKDAGEYTCIAENNAGRLEATAYLNVIIKPRVQRLQNQTFPINKKNAKLTCQASGDPLPKIVWRKWSKNEPFFAGGQPDDDRIIVEENIISAPDYTDGERKWKESTIIIDGVKRADDGLYECQAENEGGRFYKSGHITVEFGPTFEDQLTSKEWSWDQRPIKLSCIATAIPNATVTWWYEGKELGKKNLDRNYEIKGHGPSSDLTVTPLKSEYYGKYKCKAQNPYGEAFHEIELEEAHEPSQIQQAIIDKTTATTLQFRFVQPTDMGGLPIDAYAVEYKESRSDWEGARRRVWPAAQNGGYILEDLSPKTTYHLRFGCKNRVGFSEWGAGQTITMPRRGRPEPPILNTEQFGVEIEGDVIELNTSNSYELSWQIPEDNGLPIDLFLLTYYPVRKETTGGGEWSRVGDITKKEIPHRGNVRDRLDLQFQDTYYRIVLQAHNELGYSTESSIIIKTKKGEDFEKSSKPAGLSSPDLPLIPIVGAILAILIILIVLIDLIFYKTKDIGVTYLLCQKARMCRKFDPKKESKKIKGQRITSANGSSNRGTKEEDPLIYSQKKHSQVSVNRAGNNKTSISNGHEYAV